MTQLIAVVILLAVIINVVAHVCLLIGRLRDRWSRPRPEDLLFGAGIVRTRAATGTIRFWSPTAPADRGTVGAAVVSPKLRCRITGLPCLSVASCRGQGCRRQQMVTP